MRLRLATSLLLLTSLVACSDPAGVVPADRYIASVLSGGQGRGVLTVTETTGGVAREVDVTGMEIRLDLVTDGTTAGHMLVPRALGEPGATADETIDLAGTWTRAGDVVTLRHSADTFLRDMPLTVIGETLAGDRTFGSTRVRLTLVRLQER